MTVGLALRWLKDTLKDTDADRAEPYWLICHILECGRSELDLSYTFSDAQYLEMMRIVESRKLGKALDCILGYSEFYGNRYVINEHVLVPRMDTESVCEKAIQIIKSYDRPVNVLDLCTGSGCIACTIATNVDNIGLLVASDISAEALKVAELNLQNIIGDKCKWRAVQSDMFSAFARGEISKDISNNSVSKDISDRDALNNFSNALGDIKFDLIISNPPYIAEYERGELSREVLNQPHIALFGGDDGMDFYRVIADRARDFLNDGGALILEIGSSQGSDVSEILKNNGYSDVQVFKDLSGLDRGVVSILNSQFSILN